MLLHPSGLLDWFVGQVIEWNFNFHPKVLITIWFYNSELKIQFDMQIKMEFDPKKPIEPITIGWVKTAVWCKNAIWTKHTVWLNCEVDPKDPIYKLNKDWRENWFWSKNSFCIKILYFIFVWGIHFDSKMQFWPTNKNWSKR